MVEFPAQMRQVEIDDVPSCDDIGIDIEYRVAKVLEQILFVFEDGRVLEMEGLVRFCVAHEENVLYGLVIVAAYETDTVEMLAIHARLDVEREDAQFRLPVARRERGFAVDPADDIARFMRAFYLHAAQDVFVEQKALREADVGFEALYLLVLEELT